MMVSMAKQFRFFLLLIGAAAVYLAWPYMASGLRSQSLVENVPAERVPPFVVASGEVDVLGGILPLSPAQMGIVIATPVKEGEAVKKGSPLVCLDARQSAGQVAQAKSHLASAVVRRGQALRATIESALKEKLTEQAVKEAQAQVDAQRLRWDRLADLAEKKVGTPQDAQAAKIQLEAFQAALRIQQLRAEQLQLEKPDEIVRLADADLKAAEAALSMAEAQHEMATLLAPTDGVILRMLVKPGQVFSFAGREPAVWFRPNLPWVVRCEVDQQYIGFVADGMPCEIFEDRGEQRLAAGVVQSRAEWVTAQRTTVDETSPRRHGRTVECVVALTGEPTNLRIGQRVRVVIHNKSK
jgi:multidrug resistance efflux pump